MEAAKLDDQRRTASWYKELVTVYAFIVRKVSLRNPHHIVPFVVHISWTPVPNNAPALDAAVLPPDAAQSPAEALGSSISVRSDEHRRQLRDLRREALLRLLRPLPGHAEWLAEFQRHEVAKNMGVCAETVPLLRFVPLLFIASHDQSLSRPLLFAASSPRPSRSSSKIKRFGAPLSLCEP